MSVAIELHDYLKRRPGWTEGEDGYLRWRPMKRTDFMPDQLEDVLICEGLRVHSIKPLMRLPVCYLGPARNELAAIAQDWTVTQ